MKPMNHPGQIIAAGSLIFLLAAGVAPEVMSWHQLISDFGFPVALVMFFVWNGWKREERITASMSALDTFVRDQLLEINNKSIQSMADNTRALVDLVRTLETKPCLLAVEPNWKQLKAPQQQPPA